MGADNRKDNIDSRSNRQGKQRGKKRGIHQGEGRGDDRRQSDGKRVAAVDVGSNTVRLMVAEKKPGLFGEDAQSSFDVLKRSFKITRLGEGLGERGGSTMILGQGAIDRTIKVLVQFKDTWEKLEALDCRVVATSAARDAENKNDFVDAAKKIGIRVEIISEREEAELALLGIARTVDLKSGTALAFDIGGGSTEFTLTENGVVVDTLSTDLGVVRLKEMFIFNDPPTNIEMEELEKFVEKRVQLVYNRTVYNRYRGKFEKEDGEEDGKKEDQPFPHPSSLTSSVDILVGTAGTVTTLAAMDMGVKATKDYNPTRVDGYTLSYSRVQEYLDILKSITNEERLLKYPVLENGREDVITTGVVIVIKIMKVFGMEILTVSDGGLLEGIVLDLMG